VSVVYNCCWSSAAQSFSCPSPVGLMTTFFCLRFETPPTWRARPLYLYPPGTGWPNYTLRHWVPFSSPTTRRATVEVIRPRLQTGAQGQNSRPWPLLLRRIDPLLGKDLETNNGTANAMQQRGKHASTTIELLLETVFCNPLLGNCSNGNAGGLCGPCRRVILKTIGATQLLASC
jgi:hypothetical protein